MSRTRSLIGYYGGKSAMSHFIANQLDYTNTSTYIEMFGGGARVLLNKPRHRFEIYTDYSSSLCSLMELMADPRQCDELIHRIHNTKYSQEEFDRAKHIVDFVDTEPMVYYTRELKKILTKYNIFPDMENFWPSVLEKRVTPQEYLDSQWEEKIKNPSTILDLENSLVGASKKVRNAILNDYGELLSKYKYLMNCVDIESYYGFHLDDENLGKPYTPMDAAVAAYVVYTQSRDNMGQYWSKEKFKKGDAYYKHMHNLYDCADRLENVEVHTLDSMIFFRKLAVDDSGGLVAKWLNDPYIMMYADPSYISPVDENQLLIDTTDWESIDNWSEELMDLQFKKLKDLYDKEQKNKQKKKSSKTLRTPKIKLPKNLGERVYSKSFDYTQHENFLNLIKDAKCKMMVSNYDLRLYNKYLNPDTGWRKITYETKTTVGSKKDNRRTECLWCNF